MSSDDDLYGTDARRQSLVSPQPPSAGGLGPESPTIENANADVDKLNPTDEPAHTTANDITNTDEQVKRVLYSDIGLSVLLNRIKQDIATCKELGTLLKKRALIEDEHGKSLQKLTKATQDTLKRSDIKQQGFNHQLFQAIRAWDESIASSINFASQVHAMADEIIELSKVIERKRKGYKHESLRDETSVTAAETVAEKARTKHESLGLELERAISASRGESLPPQKGRFVMARKTGAQLLKHEEDLRFKLMESDRDLQGKRQAAAEVRRELMNTCRPRNIKNLVDLITEADSALSFYLQKFAILTETLALSQGSAVLPVSSGGRGFSALIEQINDGRDFRDYVLEFSAKVPDTNRYGEQDPINQPNAADIPAVSSNLYGRGSAPQLPEVDSSINRGEIYQDVQRVGASPNGSPSFAPSMTFPIHSTQPMPTYASPLGQTTVTYPSSSQPPAIYSSDQPPQTIAPTSRHSPTYPSEQHTASYSPNVSSPYQTSSGIQPAPTSTFNPSSLYTSPSPPIERDTQPAPTERPSTSGHQPSYPPVPIPSQSPAYGHSRTPSAANGFTFGVPIDDVIARENATLPLIVAQCVIAVNQFGLRDEGIYRVSGSVTNAAKLKHLFDFEPDHIDFRTPAGFFNDIHAVAGILKQYLRELPEPLLTRASYNDFIRAASTEPDLHRRDAVHSIINDLPDANYSCIRTLALHLHDVAENSEFNRMTAHNLASIFGPTLLGSENSGVEDNRAQIRITETIITHAMDIFELEDE